MPSLRLVCVMALMALVAGCASHTPRSTAGSGYKVGKPYQINGVWYTPREQPDYKATGLASWYGPGFHGNRTANGEVYDQRSLTAAHATLPLPVNVRVTNLENGRSLVVRVNDRGPFHDGRIIDVSERSAELLGFKQKGTARVRVEYLGRSTREPYTMEASPRGAPTERVARSQLPRSGAQVASMAPIPNPSAQAPVTDPNGTPMAPVPNPPTQMAPIPDSAPAMEPVPNPPGVQYRFQTGPQPLVTTAPSPGAAPTIPAHRLTPGHMYVQVGAYTDANNAYTIYNQVLPVGKVSISPTDEGGQRVYRVRLGPVANADEASRLMANLRARGHGGAQIMME